MNATLFSIWNAGRPMFASIATRTFIEYLIYGGAILLVAGAIFFWAVAVRKPRKRKHRHHWHSASRKSSVAPNAAIELPPRRRRSEPPRNPTLAETRGLPPLRDGQGNSTQHHQN